MDNAGIDLINELLKTNDTNAVRTILDEFDSHYLNGYAGQERLMLAITRALSAKEKTNG